MKEITADKISTPDKNKTEVVCILDRSGSMAHLQSTTVEQVNKFIQEQKELPGECLLTIILFDDLYEILYDGIDVQDASFISEKEYIPRGMTGLFDAIGKTVRTVEQRHAHMEIKDRPGQTLVCIVTDGQENCSKEYTDDTTIKDMIQEKEDNGWKFIYLSAAPSAFDDSASFGISQDSTMVFDGSGNLGTVNAYSSIRSATASYRSTGDVDITWSTDGTHSGTENN